MQQFEIPFLSPSNANPDVNRISSTLDKLPRQVIGNTPWPAFPYRPDISFSIAHDGQNIFLKYYVEENAAIAIYNETNGPVYKDSCVEFFIAFDNDAAYYNIEFNCAGTCLIGFGESRIERQLLPTDVIEKIESVSTFNSDNAPSSTATKWELSIVIPISVFCHHAIVPLTDRLCRVNFYKCGDDLPTPHYLSWAPIISDAPNFHLPEYFKKAKFQSIKQ